MRCAAAAAVAAAAVAAVAAVAAAAVSRNSVRRLRWVSLSRFKMCKTISQDKAAVPFWEVSSESE